MKQASSLETSGTMRVSELDTTGLKCRGNNELPQRYAFINRSAVKDDFSCDRHLDRN